MSISGLIDSHAHLTYAGLRERVDEVLANCAAAGVERVITIGTRLADAREAMELARRHPERIHAAVGFHPHEANNVAPQDLEAMAELWNDPLVMACGEMGLDYHYDFADHARQREVFAAQLEQARDKDKPIIIHCRNALDDVAPMLIERGFEHRRVVFHCFTGTPAEGQRIAAHGWRISFTGIVTFPNSGELQTIARSYPADQLMVETDSPYLSPVPVRSKKPCEPAFVANTARFLAELRQVSYHELARTTAENTRTFFGL